MKIKGNQTLAERTTERTNGLRTMRYFPIFLDLNDRTVIVVGGGEEALRKIRLLLKTNAELRVIAPALHDEIAGEPRVQWLARRFSPELLAGATLVYSTDADLHEEVAAAARLQDIPVNAVDAPGISSFITPSIVDRDPLVVAVGTEGNAPVLAVGLRAKIDAALPAELGKLAVAAGALRERVAGLFPAERRRRAFWQTFFFGAPRNAFMRGDQLGYARAVETALEFHREAMPGRVAFLGLADNDSGLVTLKAQRRLLEADVIIYAPEVAPVILDLARRDAVRIVADDTEAPALLIAEAQAGRIAVRIAMGLEEVSLVESAGVAVEVLPMGVPGTQPSTARHSAEVVPFPIRSDIREAVMRAAS
jgi:uroporphyrin-III C-methyltransferase / precorrin-2 dehydrogenase / sirohydrochlorin ferrochelatase